jgi:hypothetical protein
MVEQTEAVIASHQTWADLQAFESECRFIRDLRQLSVHAAGRAARNRPSRRQEAAPSEQVQGLIARLHYRENTALRIHRSAMAAGRTNAAVKGPRTRHR